MKNKMKVQLQKLIIIAFLLGTIPNYYAQVEEDSVANELGELLKINVEEEKYVSSASKYDQTPEEAPSSISIITAEDIKTFGYQTLVDVLNAQNGFYISNDRSSTYIGVRGFRRPFDNNNRILLLEDGIRLNSYQVDNAPTSLHLERYDRIEIVRGPGSTLYGNNAVLTVINLIPKTQFNSYLPNILAKYGSYNTKKANLQFGKIVNNKFSFFVDGYYNNIEGEDLYFAEYDTPQTNNGWAIIQDKLEESALYSRINYSDFKLTTSYKSRLKNIPTSILGTSFNKEQTNSNNRFIANLNWSNKISFDKYLSIKLNYDYNFTKLDLPFDFLPENIEFNSNTSAYSAELQFIWDWHLNHRLITGVQYVDNVNSDYKYFTGNLSLLESEWNYKILSFYFQNEYQYDANLSLYFGIRIDNFINQEVAFNPRAGVVYSPFKNHIFKLLYGRSFRAPNLIERNLEERNIVRYKKNENLKSEYINTLEFIYNPIVSKVLSPSLAVYYYKMDGLIDQVVDPLDGLSQHVNVAKVEAIGFEAEINYKYSAYGKSILRYTYQSSTNEDNQSLTNSPEHLVKLLVSERLLNHLNIGFELLYETKRKTNSGLYTEPILLSNLNFYSNKLLDYVTVSFRINNFFNKTIKHPAGFMLEQESIIQPYRNYLFTLGVEF